MDAVTLALAKRLVNDLANAGLQIQPQGVSRAGLGSIQDREASDRLSYRRNSVGYDTYGRLYTPGTPVAELVQGKRGMHISGSLVNLFPNGNTDFENDLTGWSVAYDDSTNGSVVVSAEQAFVGTKSAKIYGGDNAGDFVRLFQQYTWGSGEYAMAFAIYSPHKPPTAPDVYAYCGSNDYVIDAFCVPSEKAGWWWVITTATGDSASRRFGVRIGGQQTFYVDAFCLVEGSIAPISYIGTRKEADTLHIVSRDIPKQFIAGVLVRTDHTDAMVKDDAAARLLTMRAVNGDEYRVEYRPSTKQFAAVKKIGETEVEALSNPVQFNRRAVIGVAVQQTEEVLRLYMVSPRAIVVNFDDGYQDVYSNAFPTTQKYGIPGTFHVITGNVGTPGYCTEYELRELKEAGWCIDNHTVTHPDLTLLDEAGQRAEIEAAMNWLRARGFDYHIFASPSGKTNNTTIRLLRQLGTRLHRNYLHNSEVWPIRNIMDMKSEGINHIDTPEYWIGKIDEAMAAYKLINVAWHHVAIGEAGTYYDPEKFGQIMQAIASKGYPCYTLAEMLDAWELGKVIGKVEQFSTPSETTISGISNVFIGHDHEGANHFDGAYLDWFATGDVYGTRELAQRWGCKW